MTAETTSRGRALVLGGGGIVGTAWMAGLAAGLRRGGVALADADVIVGTSAGAILGALLATGQDLDRLRTPPDGLSQVSPDRRRLAEVFAVLGNPDTDDIAARRAVGRLAREAPTASEETHIARMAGLIGATDWPDRDLRVTAIDTETGEPRIWRRADGVALAAAVASSTGFPCLYPSITINGRRYMDGSVRAGAHTELAEGADVLVVLEPTAHLSGSSAPSVSSAAPDRTVWVTPDAATLTAFDPELSPPEAWTRAYEAGSGQAGEVIARVRDAWSHDTGADQGRRHV